jgi:hypothetical protein
MLSVMVVRTLAFVIVRRVLGLVGLGSNPDVKDVEIAVLRHQLTVLRRQVVRPRYVPTDRMVLAVLARWLPRERWSVFLVRPATLLRWHRELVARRWTYRHTGRGQQGLDPDIIELVPTSFPQVGRGLTTGMLASNRRSVAVINFVDENHRVRQHWSRCDHDRRGRSRNGGGLRYIGCVTNQEPETSSPIIYGLALSTPAHVVQHLAAALNRYQRRIGTRWRAHDTTTQAILTYAWPEGGHTYRKLGQGNGVPKSTCRTLVQEGIKVLARRALPLTEVVYLAVKAGWDYLI